MPHSSFILIPQIQTIYSHSSDKNSTFTLGRLTSGYHLSASSSMLFIKTLVTPPHLSGTLALWSFDFLLPFSQPISRSMQTTCTNNFFFFLPLRFLSFYPSEPFLSSLDLCLPKPQRLINSFPWAQVCLLQHLPRKTHSLTFSFSASQKSLSTSTGQAPRCLNLLFYLLVSKDGWLSNS